jgi:hypothetical protein
MYGLFLLSSPFLAHFLHIDHVVPFVLVGTVIVLAFATTFASSAVQ